MTDEEYVIILKNCAFMLADGIKYMKEEQQKQFKEAYEKAIEALSAEPCEDAISRKAVIKAIKNWWSTAMMAEGKPTLCEDIKHLSSVKVEPQGFEEYLNQYLGENDQMIIGKNVYEELKYELETLKKSAEPQEWISVKDRLPDNIYREGYWVTLKNAKARWTGKVRLNAKEFVEYIEYEKNRCDVEVIAWQPITEPSPYKGDE